MACQVYDRDSFVGSQRELLQGIGASTSAGDGTNAPWNQGTWRISFESGRFLFSGTASITDAEIPGIFVTLRRNLPSRRRII